MMKKNVSKKGYKKNSPDKKNPYNVIPSGHITMKGVPHPVLGVDNLGTRQMMYPGEDYVFPGDYVLELPMKQQGGSFTADSLRYQKERQRLVDTGMYQKPKIFTSNQWQRQSGMGDFALPAGATGAVRYRVSADAPLPVLPNFYSDPIGEDTYIYIPLFPEPVPEPVVTDQQQIAEPVSEPNFVYSDPLVQMDDEISDFEYDRGPSPTSPWMQQFLDDQQLRAQGIINEQGDPNAYIQGRSYTTTAPALQKGGNFNIFDNMKGSEKPCYECGGTHMKTGGKWIQPVTESVKRRGTEGVCSGNKFGGPTCPPGSKRYNLAKTFRKMAESREFGGELVGEQTNPEDIITQQKSMMVNFLRSNALSHLAMEEADNAVNMFNDSMKMKYGGNYMKTAQKGINYQDSIPVNPTGNLGSQYREYLLQKQQEQDFANKVVSGQPLYEFPFSESNGNQQQVRPDYSGVTPDNSGARSVGSNGYYTRNVPNYSSANQSNTSQPALGQRQAPPPVAVPNYTNQPVYQRPVNFQGNYQGSPVQPNMGSAYASGTNQMVTFPTFNNPYSLFPINTNPYYQFKGPKGGFNTLGLPQVAFDPSSTQISISGKKRLFGPGFRKGTITFTPSGFGSQAETPTTNVSDTQNLDAYVEKNMDSTLYSKMLEGDASDQEIAEFNKEYQRLASQYEDSPFARQGEDKPSPFGTKLKNFLQERRVKRDRKKNKAANLKTVSDLSVMPMQAGGESPFMLSDLNPVDDQIEPFVMNQDEISQPVSFEFKRKLGIPGQEAVDWGLTGLNALTGMKNNLEARQNEQLMRNRMFSDALYPVIPAGSTSRGDYSVNEGYFRPDQHVPVQFSGDSYGTIGSPFYRHGGQKNDMPQMNMQEDVLYLTDDQIAQIKAQGGEIEYID